MFSLFTRHVQGSVSQERKKIKYKKLCERERDAESARNAMPKCRKQKHKHTRTHPVHTHTDTHTESETTKNYNNNNKKS